MRILHRKTKPSWERKIPILTTRRRATYVGLAVVGFFTAAWSSNGIVSALSVISIAISLVLGFVTVYLNDNVSDKMGLRRTIDQTILIVCVAAIVAATVSVYLNLTKDRPSGYVFSEGFTAATDTSALIDYQTRERIISKDYPSDGVGQLRFGLRLENDTGRDIQISGFDLKIAGKLFPLVFYSSTECRQQQHSLPYKSTRLYGFKSVVQRPEDGGISAPYLQLLAQQNVPLSLVIRTIDAQAIEVSTTRDKDPATAQKSEDFKAEFNQMQEQCPDSTAP